MAAPRICSVEGCDKPARGHGWCSAHYTRWRRYGDPLETAPPREIALCAAPGCETRSQCQGYCGVHYMRWTRYGDPLGGGTAWGKPREWLLAHVTYADPNACLIWPFARETNGYAVLRVGKRNERAHREMCRLAHGEPPSPLHESAHSCGKGHEGCVNPHHVRWDTRSGNFADKLIHGTHNRGDQSPIAKLTEAEVRVIKRLIGRQPIAMIAARFGVSPGAIYSIRSGASWAWMD